MNPNLTVGIAGQLPILSGKLRLLLAMMLVLMTYDGVLRKWGFQSIEQIIFLIKDVILIYCLFLAFPKKTFAPFYLPSTFKFYLMLYLIWGFLEIFNPSTPNLLVGLWGFKSHFIYIALILIFPIAFGNLSNVFVTLEKIYPWIVVPVCVFAILQIVSGAESDLNRQLNFSEESSAFFGDQNLVRVNGTFSYIAGMAAFEQAMLLLGVGLYLLNFARSKKFIAGLFILILVLPLTGSRGVLITGGAFVIIMIIVGWKNKVVDSKSVIKATIFLAVLMLASLILQDEAWTAIQQRFNDGSEEGYERYLAPLIEPFSYIHWGGMIGYGLGTANVGSMALIGGLPPFYWFPPGVGGEAEPGRIVLELGFLGWLITLGLRISALVWAIRIAIYGKKKIIRGVGMISIPVMLFGVYSGTGVFSAPYAAITYWFMVALLGMAEFEQHSPESQNTSKQQRTVFRV